MNEHGKSWEITSREQLGVVSDPKNILKTIASGFPVASSFVEVLNQLDGHRVDKKLTALEAKLGDLEEAQPKQLPAPQEWPHAVGEYFRRQVEFAVFYDGKADTPADEGKELYLPVAYGCFVDKGVVLACSEALEFANGVAKHKGGKVQLILDLVRYDFAPEKLDDASGLVTCHITKRDEDQYQERNRHLEKRGVRKLFVTEPLETAIGFTVTPWLGQEIGFLHTGEAPNIGGWPKFQFDTSVISHFRTASDWALKAFVTGVLPGRVKRLGSPVFTQTGTLVGIVAGTESYSSDAGRRAVVKSLLGHPRFTKFTKKS